MIPTAQHYDEDPQGYKASSDPPNLGSPVGFNKAHLGPTTAAAVNPEDPGQPAGQQDRGTTPVDSEWERVYRQWWVSRNITLEARSKALAARRRANRASASSEAADNSKVSMRLSLRSRRNEQELRFEAISATADVLGQRLNAALEANPSWCGQPDREASKRDQQSHRRGDAEESLADALTLVQRTFDFLQILAPEQTAELYAKCAWVTPGVILSRMRKKRQRSSGAPSAQPLSG